MTMSNQYTCTVCGNTYDKGWSDEEAETERLENWPDLPKEECDIVCDDCFKKMGLAS